VTCKIDHSDPECIPGFLCARCHPETVLTPQEYTEALERLKTTQRTENAELQRKQELLRTQSKLAAIERRHHGDVGGIDARIAKSLEAKIERLENGECLEPRRRRKRKAASTAPVKRHKRKN
jgi:hypothetical protein